MPKKLIFFFIIVVVSFLSFKYIFGIFSLKCLPNQIPDGKVLRFKIDLIIISFALCIIIIIGILSREKVVQIFNIFYNSSLSLKMIILLLGLFFLICLKTFESETWRVIDNFQLLYSLTNEKRREVKFKSMGLGELYSFIKKCKNEIPENARILLSMKEEIVTNGKNIRIYTSHHYFFRYYLFPRKIYKDPRELTILESSRIKKEPLSPHIRVDLISKDWIKENGIDYIILYYGDVKKNSILKASDLQKGIGHLK